MSTAFILGGLVVAGVFAFVYLQNKKKKEQGQSNNNNNANGNVGNNGNVGTVDAEDPFANSSSGEGGYAPTEDVLVENAPAEEHNTAPANEPAVESIPNRDEENQNSR